MVERYAPCIVKQMIVSLDERMIRELERVAPARSRRRSEFIRKAIRKALDEESERRMEEAYRRMPQSEEEWFDPETWIPAPPGSWDDPPRRRRAKRR